MKTHRRSLRSLLRKRRREIMKAKLGFRRMICSDTFSWWWQLPIGQRWTRHGRRGNQRKPPASWMTDRTERYLQ